MTTLDELSFDAKAVTMENDSEFSIFVLEQNEISNLDATQPNYLDKLIESDFIKEGKMDPNNYMEDVGKNLSLTPTGFYDLKVSLFFEDKKNIYEIIYLNYEPPEEKDIDENKITLTINELASLLTINGDKIYGNALILKTKLPVEDYSMKYEDFERKDIRKILERRINTKIVVYEDDYRELDLVGNIETFAESFFEKRHFKRLEIPFLKHNINILYTVFEYGEENVCGTIIKEKIDKCIWFSMYSAEYSCDLSLDEVNKIIYLSDKLDKYDIPEEFLKEEKDDMNRKLIKNKYRILERVYKNNI
jgi:hypothetical protein